MILKHIKTVFYEIIYKINRLRCYMKNTLMNMSYAVTYIIIPLEAHV